MRHRHDGDRGDVHLIERAQVREEVRRRFDEIAAGRQVEDRGGRCGPVRQIPTECQQRLAGADVGRIEPQPGTRRVMGREEARRQRRTGFLRRHVQTMAERLLDVGARDAARPQQHCAPGQAGHDHKARKHDGGPGHGMFVQNDAVRVAHLD